MELISKVRFRLYQTASGSSKEARSQNNENLSILFQSVTVDVETHAIYLKAIVEEQKYIVEGKIDLRFAKKLNLPSEYQLQSSHSSTDDHDMDPDVQTINKMDVEIH